MVVNSADWSPALYEQVKQVVQEVAGQKLPRLDQVGYPSAFNPISHNLFARNNTRGSREVFLACAIDDTWNPELGLKVREILDDAFPTEEAPSKVR